MPTNRAYGTCYTPRKSTQSSPRDRKGWGGPGCEERRLGRRAAGESCSEGTLGGWCAIHTVVVHVSGWGGGAWVPCPCGAGLGDNAELGGGYMYMYGGRIRLVAVHVHVQLYRY
eukprot:COSAG05_NODE_166_length_15185_cov_10.343497_6_plen_114_part_00